MPTVVPIRERIERQALLNAQQISGIASGYRADFRERTYQHLDVVVFLSGDTANDPVQQGITYKRATLTVGIFLMPPESSTTALMQTANFWLYEIERTFIADGAFIEQSGPDLIQNIDTVATTVPDLTDNQGAGWAAVSFELVYAHDRDDPSSYGSIIETATE